MIPIFIGGTGRSGTSILKKVIGQHPDVSSIPTELRVVVDPGGALDLHQALTKRWSPYAGDIALQRFENLLKRAESTNKMKRSLVVLMHKLGISPISYTDYGVGDHFGRSFYKQRRMELIDSLSYASNNNIWAGTPSLRYPARMLDTPCTAPDIVARSIEQFFTDLFTNTGKSGDKSHWIEDTPYNLLHLNELLEIFPNLKFLHIYRDFRDVVTSYRVQHWGGGDVESVARRVAAVMARWHILKPTIPTDVYLEVSLEDVVANPTKFYEKFLEFSGLTESVEMKNHLTELDSTRLHAGRWENELTLDEQNLIKPILEKIMEEYGYR